MAREAEDDGAGTRTSSRKEEEPESAQAEVVEPPDGAEDRGPGSRTFPEARYSRFPWINQWFGRSLVSFTKAINAYTGLVKADKELKVEYIEHQRVETQLRNLDAILETERLKIHNELATQKRTAQVSDLETKLAVADLESELELRLYNKERLERERQKLARKPPAKQG